MTKSIGTGFRGVVAFLALMAFVVAGIAGCSRYAPVPPAPPSERILRIRLTTREPVSDDYYYYVVLDTSNDPESEGPLPNLYGEERAKNWSYYVVLHSGIFKENVIATEEERDDEPVLFNNTSGRYYSTSISGSSIIVEIRLSSLSSDNKLIGMNFITGRGPLTPTDEKIEVLDYLYGSPFVVTNQATLHINHEQYPDTSGHSVTDSDDYPADVIAWYVDINEI